MSVIMLKLELEAILIQISERNRDVTQSQVEGPPAKSSRLSPSCKKTLHEMDESANGNSISMCE